MSDDMQGLTRIDGWFSCPGSGGDWQMWRNNDGFIELYRTKKVEDDGTKHGIERKVTFAREPNELFAYFSKRTSRHKQGRDPDQIDLYEESEKLTAEQERHEQEP